MSEEKHNFEILSKYGKYEVEYLYSLGDLLSVTLGFPNRTTKYGPYPCFGFITVDNTGEISFYSANLPRTEEGYMPEIMKNLTLFELYGILSKYKILIDEEVLDMFIKEVENCGIKYK